MHKIYQQENLTLKYVEVIEEKLYESILWIDMKVYNFFMTTVKKIVRKLSKTSSLKYLS